MPIWIKIPPFAICGKNSNLPAFRLDTRLALTNHRQKSRQAAIAAPEGA